MFICGHQWNLLLFLFFWFQLFSTCILFCSRNMMSKWVKILGKIIYPIYHHRNHPSRPPSLVRRVLNVMLRLRQVGKAAFIKITTKRKLVSTIDGKARASSWKLVAHNVLVIVRLRLVMLCLKICPRITTQCVVLFIPLKAFLHNMEIEFLNFLQGRNIIFVILL